MLKANNVICETSKLWLCDKTSKNVTTGPKPKTKKMWFLFLSISENHNLTVKTAKRITKLYSGKKEHSLFADTKLQEDQIDRKRKQKSPSNCLFENQIFLNVKRTISFQKKTIKLNLSCLGNSLHLSPVGFF